MTFFSLSLSNIHKTVEDFGSVERSDIIETIASCVCLRNLFQKEKMEGAEEAGGPKHTHTRILTVKLGMQAE